MAEGDSRFAVYDDEKTGEKKYTIYSTTGKPVSGDKFDEQMRKYESTGQVSEGYIVLTPGAMDKMRRGFEFVNEPVQKFLPAAGQAVVSALTTPFREAMGTAQIDPRSGMIQAAKDAPPNIGHSVGEFIGEQINTPEKLAATLGTVVGTAMTGGVSVPLQMAGIGLTTGFGRLAGSALTGTGGQPGQALQEAGIVAAGVGLQGAIKFALGRAMSQRAVEDVASEIMEIARKRHPHLANDPNLMNIAMSDKDLVARFTKLSSKKLEDEMFNLGKRVSNEIAASLPNPLTRQTAPTYHGLMRKLEAQGRALSESAVDPKKYNEARRALFDAGNDLVLFATEGITDPAIARQVATDVTNTLNSYTRSMLSRRETEAMLHGLNAGMTKAGQFDVARYQRAVAPYYQEIPGSTLELMGRASGRGVPLTSGTDRKMIPSIPIPLTKGRLKTPPMGNRYIGKVESGTGTALATLAGAEAIRSLMSGDKE